MDRFVSHYSQAVQRLLGVEKQPLFNQDPDVIIQRLLFIAETFADHLYAHPQERSRSPGRISADLSCFSVDDFGGIRHILAW